LKPCLSTAILVIAGCASFAHAQRPLSDPAFGGHGDGIARFRISANDQARDTALAAAVLADGRLVLGGTMEASGQTRFQFARLTPDGAPDTTFGSDGSGAFALDLPSVTTMTHLIASDEHAILFAGTTLHNTGIIGKVDDRGMLDSRFGQDGLRVVDVERFLEGGIVYRPLRLLRLRSGRTLVVGFALSGQPSACAALLRLTEDGALDRTFADDGVACLAPHTDAPPLALGTMVTEAGDGTLFLTGGAYHDGGSGFDMFVARMDANGRPDADFGSDGSGFAYVGFDSGGGLHDIAHDIAIDGANRIVVAGAVAAPWSDNDFDMGIARLLADGRIDASFAEGGRLQFSPPIDGGSTEVAQDIALVDGNRVLVGGWSKEQRQVATLLMLDDSGRLDPHFGDGGVFRQAATTAPEDEVVAVVPHNFLQAGDHLYLFGSIPVGEPLPDLHRRWAFAATRYVLPLFDDGFDAAPEPTGTHR
jgi:uncharacterized delta-60 repeat protein